MELESSEVEVWVFGSFSVWKFGEFGSLSALVVRLLEVCVLEITLSGSLGLRNSRFAGLDPGRLEYSRPID